jgi:hypothetical protein
VVEDVRASVHDHLERPVAVVEIGDEHLDDDLGIHLADGADRFPEMLGAAIAEIVTGDGGDDDMAQVHAAGGLGDTGGLVGFQGVGLRGFHGAEATGAGALVACDHESGRALPPAFPTVRALGLLADGNQLEIGDQRLRGPEGRVVRQAHLDPVRFSLPVEGGIHFHFRATSGHAGNPKF